MKKSILGILALSLLTVVPAFADDCSDAIFKLNDTMSSKDALDLGASFFGVMVVNDLNQKDADKRMFDAFTASDEEKASQTAFFAVSAAVQKACLPKGKDCLIAAFKVVNDSGEARNAYELALAENTLVKEMKSGDLFAASQKYLAAQLDAYATLMSDRIDSATSICAKAVVAPAGK